jgi:hypothetical protein
MNEDFFFSLLGNYVFPIFICVYLLFRMEKSIQKNTEAIVSLEKAIREK